MTAADPDTVAAILDELIARYGTHPWNWHTQQDPFRVLIGTVLSQRTRDEKTDLAAQQLFARFPTPEALATASVDSVESCIRPANYYKTKAKRVRDIAAILVRRYNGKVPAEVRELMQLPGVGRKTANCVMVYGFRKRAIPVDTHVHRICNRIGLVKTTTARETEVALWNLLPERYILHVNELLVKHGQTVCRPQRPRCADCPLERWCAWFAANRAAGPG